MVWWLALAGIGTQALGQYQASEAAEQAAQTQADIEKMNREAQERRFRRDVEYQRPFFEAGELAVPEFKKSLMGDYDLSKSPLYNIQKNMVKDSLGGTETAGSKKILDSLEAQEMELSKGRLIDLQKVGLGTAGTAGQTAISFGSAYSSSLQRTGGALAQGALTSSMQRQNAWMGAMEQASGYPAYSYQRSAFKEPDMNAQAKLQSGKSSAFTNYELMY